MKLRALSMYCSCLLTAVYMMACAAARLPRTTYRVYEGYATAARMAMIAAVIITSMSVKPRCLDFNALSWSQLSSWLRTISERRKGPSPCRMAGRID